MCPLQARRHHAANVPVHFVQSGPGTICYSEGIQGLTVPPPTISVSTDQNSSAEAQHAATGTLTPAPNRPAEQLSILDTQRGQMGVRTFRVQNGILEEQIDDPSAPGGRRWLAAGSTHNPNGAVQSLYFADGHLYDSAGNRLGRFGINSQAGSSLAGASFLTTYGTLHNNSGQLVDYSGLTMTLGGSRALIVMGPPPGLVPVYVQSTRDVLMDSQCGRYFHQRNGDVAYERQWVLPANAATASSPRFTAEQILALPLDSDGYRYTPDGRLRFRSSSDGVLTAQARLHLATNWRGGNGLEMARVSWSAAPTVIQPAAPVIPVVTKMPSGPKVPVAPVIPVDPPVSIPKSSSHWLQPTAEKLPVKTPVHSVEKLPPPPVVAKAAKAPEPVYPEKLPVKQVAILPAEKAPPPVVKLPPPPVEPILPPVIPPLQPATDLEADVMFNLFVVSRYFSDLAADTGRGLLPAVMAQGGPQGPMVQPMMGPPLPGINGGINNEDNRLIPPTARLRQPDVEIALFGGAEVPNLLLRGMLTEHQIPPHDAVLGGPGQVQLGPMPMPMPRMGPLGPPGMQPGGALLDPAAAMLQATEGFVRQGVDVRLRALDPTNPLPYYQQVRALFTELSTGTLAQIEPLLEMYSQSGREAEQERTRFLARLRAAYQNRMPPQGCPNDFWMNAIDRFEDELERRLAAREGRAPRLRAQAPGPLA